MATPHQRYTTEQTRNHNNESMAQETALFCEAQYSDEEDDLIMGTSSHFDNGGGPIDDLLRDDDVEDELGEVLAGTHNGYGSDDFTDDVDEK